MGDEDKIRRMEGGTEDPRYACESMINTISNANNNGVTSVYIYKRNLEMETERRKGKRWRERMNECNICRLYGKTGSRFILRPLLR